MSHDSHAAEPNIEVIIPVYNEDALIAKTLDEIGLRINNSFRVNIIYDFTEDTTINAVKDYLSLHPDFPARLVQNTFGRGALNAIRTGFSLSRGLATLVVMADLSDDLGICDAMLEKIHAGADIVCGSRYMKGGKHIGGPKLKKLMSRLAGISLHYLARVPTHDVTNSFKMYRTQLLRELELESTGGFEIGMEIVVKSFLRGYSICEIPSVWRDRSAGSSRFQILKWLPSYLKWYFLGYSRYFRRRKKK